LCKDPRVAYLVTLAMSTSYFFFERSSECLLNGLTLVL
jgi:hypothetical protein